MCERERESVLVVEKERASVRAGERVCERERLFFRKCVSERERVRV